MSSLSIVSSSPQTIHVEILARFVNSFRDRRIKLEKSQKDVCAAIKKEDGISLSPTTLCRFERMELSYKVSSKYKAILEKWVEREENAQNPSHMLSVSPRKRSNYSGTIGLSLKRRFLQTMYPTALQISTIAEDLQLPAAKVRSWFINRRRKDKRKASRERKKKQMN